MTWQAQKLIGFAPDLPPDTPGVIVESSAIVPTERGVGNSGEPNVASATLLDDPAAGGFVATKVDGTRRIFGATNSKFYELNDVTVTPRGSGFAYGSWTFTQMGNATLACNKTSGLLACTTGNFVAVAGAPKASIVIAAGPAQKQFAILFDYNDGTDNGAGVRWSAAANYADWTPDIATEAGFNAALDLGGPFTCAIPYRDGFIAWKRRGMYLGTYVGGSGVWALERIAADVGCIGKFAAVECNDAIYFADEYGIWAFDGSFPRLVQGFVHAWWAATIAANAYAYYIGSGASTDGIRLTWDRVRQRLWIAYLPVSGGAFPHYLVFNLRSQLWAQHGPLNNSRGDAGVMQLISGDYALTNVGSITRFVLIAWPMFNDAIIPQASLRFAAVGVLGQMTQLNGMRPQWLRAPNTANFATAYCNHGSTLRNVRAQSMAMVQRPEGGFDMNPVADRYLQPVLTVNAGTGWEISEIALDFTQRGTT